MKGNLGFTFFNFSMSFELFISALCHFLPSKCLFKAFVSSKSLLSIGGSTKWIKYSAKICSSNISPGKTWKSAGGHVFLALNGPRGSEKCPRELHIFPCFFIKFFCSVWNPAFYMMILHNKYSFLEIQTRPLACMYIVPSSLLFFPP